MPKTRYKKQANGLYRAAVNVGYDADGRLVRKYFSARTCTDLEAQIRDFKLSMAEGYDVLNEYITLGEYAERWISVYKAQVGIRTREMYEKIVRKHLGELADMRVKDIKPLHVQQLINDHSDRPRTAEQIRLTLKQIFAQAIQDDLIRKSPAVNLTMPRHIKKEKRALTPEEKQAIRDAELTERERAFVMLLYGCGLRPGELFALTWQDIDFKAGVVNVSRALVFKHNNEPVLEAPKTNSSIRAIECPRIVLNALKAYRGKNICPKLFAGKDGGYNTKNGYNSEWNVIKRKIEQALGYKTDLTPYCFRHNYATMLFYSGVSMKEAQRLMGHTNHEMIMRVYSHLDAAKEQTAAKLNAIDF